MEKHKIRKRIIQFDDSIFIGNMSDVIEHLQKKFKELTEEGYENIEIEKVVPDDDDFEIFAYGLFTETNDNIGKCCMCGNVGIVTPIAYDYYCDICI